MGGPGFLGFKLAETESAPEEWLILCLWSAADWLLVNGRWLQAHPVHYHLQRPLRSNFAGHESWDDFSPLVEGGSVELFDVKPKTMQMRIGQATIEFTEDPERRPYFPGSKGPRTLAPNDDLRTAWIIAPYPWVEV